MSDSTYHYDLVFKVGDTEIGVTCVELDKEWHTDRLKPVVYPVTGTDMTMEVWYQLPGGGGVID